MIEPRVVHTTSRVPQNLVEQFRSLSSATVYEASGGQGALSSRIKPVDPGMKVCGPAVTVQVRPGDNLMLHKAIYVAREGDVIIADAQGFTEAGAWGEVMAVAAQSRGLGGLVFNGAVRDTAEITGLGFPVFSVAVCIKGTQKVSPGLINHALVLDGVVINPGDLVLGDRDGVLIVAREDAGAVLEKARARESKERDVMDRLRAGESTLDIFGLGRVLEQMQITEEQPGRDANGGTRQ
ncbi:MAG: 4-carboxy-4-hydroxy-2-oxoadipate aldolase/oxaloacetate decarboxylase [Dehalococcoidia bacterium]|nr:4-carboxy-4-hydroxy-2-oxoadipate aldolase/oxaloacetate decarboxylase [Dehalococcoidia bacterium]